MDQVSREFGWRAAGDSATVYFYRIAEVTPFFAVPCMIAIALLQQRTGDAWAYGALMPFVVVAVPVVVWRRGFRGAILGPKGARDEGVDFRLAGGDRDFVAEAGIDVDPGIGAPGVQALGEPAGLARVGAVVAGAVQDERPGLDLAGDEERGARAQGFAAASGLADQSRLDVPRRGRSRRVEEGGQIVEAGDEDEAGDIAATARDQSGGDGAEADALDQDLARSGPMLGLEPGDHGLDGVLGEGAGEILGPRRPAVAGQGHGHGEIAFAGVAVENPPFHERFAAGPSKRRLMPVEEEDGRAGARDFRGADEIFDPGAGGVGMDQGLSPGAGPPGAARQSDQDEREQGEPLEGATSSHSPRWKRMPSSSRSRSRSRSWRVSSSIWPLRWRLISSARPAAMALSMRSKWGRILSMKASASPA